MRLALLIGCAFAVTAAAPSAPGIRLDQSVVKKFTNCPATGSAAQVVPNGKYLMTVNDEKTTVCIGAICDGGYGTEFASGFGMSTAFTATDGGAGVPVACLSAGATGDVSFTLAE